MTLNYPTITIAFFLCFLSCAQDKNPDLVEIRKSINKNDLLIIENISESESCFLFKFQDGFFTTDEIVKHIKNMPGEFTGEPLERKAWRFVIDNIDYLPSISESRIIHHPLTLINSIGFGQCDDLASSLYFIWKTLGFESRIWELGGHVVPEVYANKKWQMYDPSYQVYYYNKKNDVAGVEELALNHEYISNSIDKVGVYRDNFSASGISSDSIINVFDSLRYSKFMENYYLTLEDNKINPWYQNFSSFDSMKICLSPGDEISVPVYKDQLLKMKGWLDESRGIKYYISLQIKRGDSKNILFPFMGINEIKNESVSSDIILLPINDSLYSSQINNGEEIFALINNNFINDSFNVYFKGIDTLSINIELRKENEGL